MPEGPAKFEEGLQKCKRKICLFSSLALKKTLLNYLRISNMGAVEENSPD